MVLSPLLKLAPLLLVITVVVIYTPCWAYVAICRFVVMVIFYKRMQCLKCTARENGAIYLGKTAGTDTYNLHLYVVDIQIVTTKIIYISLSLLLQALVWCMISNELTPTIARQKILNRHRFQTLPLKILSINEVTELIQQIWEVSETGDNSIFAARWEALLGCSGIRIYSIQLYDQVGPNTDNHSRAWRHSCSRHVGPTACLCGRKIQDPCGTPAGLIWWSTVW